MKKRLLSVLLAMALVVGCITALGYRDVSAASWNDMVDQEIELNEFGSFTLKYKKATVFKFELRANGSFVMDFAPDEVYVKAELYNEQGKKVGGTLETHFSNDYALKWTGLKSGIYYVKIWGTSDKKAYEQAFYTRSVASDDVVWKIGITLKKGSSIQLDAIAENCSEKDAHWVSENKKIATVSKDGKVKAKAVGTTVIKLISSSNKVAKITVEVIKKK